MIVAAQEGIRTPLELRAADPQRLRQRFGVVMQRLSQELRGVSCLPLELAAPDRKSVVASRSFGRPLTALADVEEAVASFVSRAAAKMRRQGLATAHISTFIETNPFREQDKQYRASRGVTLPVATADTATLITAAHAALAGIWREGYRYKKAGVMLVDLVKASSVGDGLFDRPDDPRSMARMRALDGVNARFGRDAITMGRTGQPRPWKLRSDRLSLRFTTHWEELLSV